MPLLPEARVIQTSRGAVEYRSIGRGHPIVFFHGGQSNALNTAFDGTFDLDRFRLIIPSRPGYGRTPLKGNASASDNARLIRALLDRLETGPAVLASVSLGARPALWFAALFPEMTRGLVLTSAITGPWMKASDVRYWPARIFFNYWTEGYLWSLTRFFFARVPELAAQLFLRGITTRRIGAISPPDLQALHDRVASGRSYRGFLSDLDHEVPDGVLAAIRCPTLIQRSLTDASVDLGQAQRAQKLIHGAYLRLYDNEFGHLLWIGPGSDVARTDIREFVEAVSSREVVRASIERPAFSESAWPEFAVAVSG